MTGTTLTAERTRPALHTMHQDWSERTGVNVGETERWLSLAGGAALALYGLNRGSLPGLAVAAMGGALAYRGLSVLQRKRETVRKLGAGA